MARKSTKTQTNTIDPITVIACALKAIKCAADYHRIGAANTPEDMGKAWQTLPMPEQERITSIVNADTPFDPKLLADELVACGNAIQLKALKAMHGEPAVKAAWKLLPQAQRERLTALCRFSDDSQPQQSPVPQPEPTPIPQPQAQPQPKPKTLIQLTADLQQLDQLLDTIDGDIPVDIQTAVDELLQERSGTQEALLEKLDNYAALIQSRAYWAATRKAEADRLAKLAEQDAKTVDFLKARLKQHLEATGQTKIRTGRFNITICGNGGQVPLRFDDTAPEKMPERFQRRRIEPNKEAIREALLAGEALNFAYLGELGTHIRIK